MRSQFNWQFDQEPHEPGEEHAPRRSRTAVASRFAPPLLVLCILLAGLGWLRQRGATARQEQIARVQALLDAGHAALLAGDGERYFALQEEEPGWLAAQLLPANLALVRAAPRATAVQEAGEFLRANVSWEQNGSRLQRIQFYAWRGGALRQVATDSAYWGDRRQFAQPWGGLRLREVDAPWAEEIVAAVAAAVEELCAGGCPPGALPLVVEVRSDYQQTAVPGHLALPSPRLVGLDEAGRPSSLFWDELGRRLADRLTPATIRFAIPPQRLQRIDYAAAAQAFSRANPALTIELLPLDYDGLDAADLNALDGAAYAPELSWITAGLVHDLSALADSDPAFDQADFYEQLWQGGLWRERLWFMPLAAEMPLLYYHRDAYEALGLAEPSLRWTWTEMERDARALPGSRLETGAELQWGYLDQTFSTLYAFAFNQQAACRGSAIRPCPAPLQPSDVSAALAWYAQLAEAETMPPVHEAGADERRRLVINSLFKTAIWVDSPVYYEHRALMFPMGVTPFPGSERFDGSSPLWLNGAFISSASARPLAVWEWLKFLSDQPPMARYRLIPARPSVAESAGFWGRLPRPLAEPMRSAFPLARPVRLADQNAFSWAQIGAVVRGETTAAEAAQPGARPRWFGVNLD